MAKRKISGSSSQPKRSANPALKRFGEQLNTFTRMHPAINKNVDFAKLIHLDPSYVTIIKQGFRVPRDVLFDQILPVLIAFGLIPNFDEAIQWIEPAYGSITRNDLLLLSAKISEIEHRDLTKEMLSNREKEFFLSVQNAFSQNPPQPDLLIPEKESSSKTKIDEILVEKPSTEEPHPFEIPQQTNSVDIPAPGDIIEIGKPAPIPDLGKPLAELTLNPIPLAEIAPTDAIGQLAHDESIIEAVVLEPPSETQQPNEQEVIIPVDEKSEPFLPQMEIAAPPPEPPLTSTEEKEEPPVTVKADNPIYQKPSLRLKRMNLYSHLANKHTPKYESLLVRLIYQENDELALSAGFPFAIQSGGNIAIAALPTLAGDYPRMGEYQIMDLLPPDPFHRAMEAWLGLLSHQSSDWRKIAAHVISCDPDQCQIEQVIKVANEDEEGPVRRSAINAIRYNIKIIKPIRSLLFLLENISKHSRFLHSESSEWVIDLVQASLEELSNEGTVFPQELKTVLLKSLLPHIEYSIYPPLSAIRSFAFPCFQENRQVISKILVSCVSRLKHDEEYMEVILASMETLFVIKAPVIKDLLLEIFLESPSIKMRNWAIGILESKTDMRLTFRQFIRLAKGYFQAGIYCLFHSESVGMNCI